MATEVQVDISLEVGKISLPLTLNPKLHFTHSINSNQEFGWAGHPPSNKSIDSVFKDITKLNSPEDLFHEVYLRMMDLSKVSVDIAKLPLRYCMYQYVHLISKE